MDFVAAFGNKQVGDLADYLNVDSGSASKILMHALLGGALSVASGGEFKTGALAGAAAEGLTQFTTDALGRFLDERIVTDDQFKVGTAQIIGILAAALGGGDPAIGSWVAGNAERYNQQVHREAKQRLESGFAILHERGEFVDLQPEDVLADLQKIAEGEKDRSQLNPKTVEFLNQFPPAALRDIFFELTDFERYVELGIDISFPTPSPVGKVKAVATISEAAAKEILQALEKKFGAALLEVEAKAARGAKGTGDWAKLSGQLSEASKGKGNFGIGSGTREQAEVMGKAWVGDGYKVASDGKTLVSQDGLRQYRPPTYKTISAGDSG